VIAIIAILASILFPVFAKAREKARQSSCNSNVRQIGIAIMSYVQDYDETFPTYSFAATPAYYWSDAVVPYIKNSQLFTCPSRRTSGWDGVAGDGKSSYGFNSNTANAFSGRSLGSFVNPSQAIVIAESYNVHKYNHCDDNTETLIQFITLSNDNATANSPHNGGENCEFSDGHAKWFSSTALYGNDNYFNPLAP
jgi:type II secretory pathway pseudopilin PulG